ncbi:MAG: hypothetical protein ABEJ43_08835 [Haloferacaceae archaeon]
MTEAESAFAGARADVVVAGAAALATVALALLGRPSLYALAPLFVYVTYQLVGDRLVEDPRVWAALAAGVGVVAALV